MNRISLMLVFAAIAGCQSAAQREREEAIRSYEQQQRIANYRAVLDRTCRGYGFQPGTPDFANCLMQVDQRNAADDDALRRALILRQLGR